MADGAPPQLERKNTQTRSGGGKLPPIPQSKPGERPHYSEMYHRAAKASLSSDEFNEVIKQYIWSCSIVYKLSNFKTHSFTQNELLQRLLQVPLAQLQRAETWDNRQETYKNFYDTVLPYCEETLKAGHRFFRNRAQMPAALVRVETSNSFIANDIGVFFHVWKTNGEAKKFVHGFRNVAEKLQELRIDTIFTPFTVLFNIYTTPVTATAIIPLVSEKPMSPVTGPILAHSLDMLEVYCRSRSPFSVYLGADARYYIMDPIGVLHSAWEANGERFPFARMTIFDSFPQIPSTADAIEESVAKSEEDALKDIVSQLNERGEAGAGVINLKIQDLVLDRVVPEALHARGVKLGVALYYMTQQKICQSEGVGTVVKETLIAEMVCRTMKEILRAEIAAIGLIPNPELGIAQAFSFVIELLNRCIYNLLVRSELWETHFLDVLRTKFRTPDSFVIPQSAVTKRLILAYLTVRLGTIFEGGKFSRCVAINVMHSHALPCPVMKLVLSANRSGAHELLLSRWKRIADIRSVSLQVCAMLHQVVLFAVARSVSLDWYCGLLQSKVNELNEATISATVEPAIIECLGELPELEKFRNTMKAYLMSHIEKVGTTSNQDIPVAVERFRSAALLLSTIEKGHEKDLVGSLRVKGSNKLLMLQQALHKALTSDVNVAMLIEAENFIYNYPNQNKFCLDIEEILKSSATVPDRCTRIAAGLQRFAGNTLNLSYEPTKPVIEAFRDIAIDNLALHWRHHGETDQRFHIALLLAACHWGFSFNAELNPDEKKAMDKFVNASLKIHNTLPSEQKELLRGEWYIGMTGPAAEVLMQHGQWGMAQHIVRFGQNQMTTSTFKALVAKINPKAALPELEGATTMLWRGINAAERLQAWFRARQKARKEREAREREEAEKRAASERERERICLTPLSLAGLIVPVAKAVADVSARHSEVTCSARLQPWNSRKSKLHGLRTLITIAKVKPLSNLCLLLMQSGNFPPIKWAITPGGAGRRYIIIVPDTDCIGSWWHSTWLQMASIGDASQTFLYAKVAACFIYTQQKYTFLNWVIAGYSFCGPIAQCLATMVPDFQIDGLITFGGPPCFTDIGGFVKVPHAHVRHAMDLLPHMVGDSTAVIRYKRFMSRLFGLGGWFPAIPTQDMLKQLSKLVYFGRHLHEITGDGKPDAPLAYGTWDSPKMPLDFRGCLSYHPDIYHAYLVRCTGKSVPIPNHWMAPYVDLFSVGIDAEGNPTQTLEDAYTVPPTVEPIVATPEQLLLAYPRIAQNLADGLSQIPDDYGMQMMPNIAVIESIETSSNVGELGALLGSYLGASWDAQWIALQLYEWSGARSVRAQSPQAASVASGRKSVYRSAQLSSPLVEAFVDLHNFFFAIAPYSSHNTDCRAGGRGTPMYIDGVDEAMRRVMQRADGYHLGWNVGIASTVRGVGKTTLAEALADETVEGEGITIAHRRSARHVNIPSVRWKWSPPAMYGKTKPIFMQVGFQEIRYDGKMASERLLHSGAQMIWLVKDLYTCNHMEANANFSLKAFYVIVYMPQFACDPQVTQAVKAFSLRHSFPYAIVDPNRKETISALQAMLIHWMLPTFRFPMNPAALPRSVEMGALYAHDEAATAQYVNSVTEPIFGKAGVMAKRVVMEELSLPAAAALLEMRTRTVTPQVVEEFVEPVKAPEPVVEDRRHRGRKLRRGVSPSEQPAPAGDPPALTTAKSQVITKVEPRNRSPRKAARSNSPRGKKPDDGARGDVQVFSRAHVKPNVKESMRLAAQEARKEIEEEERNAKKVPVGQGARPLEALKKMKERHAMKQSPSPPPLAPAPSDSDAPNPKVKTPPPNALRKKHKTKPDSEK